MEERNWKREDGGCNMDGGLGMMEEKREKRVDGIGKMKDGRRIEERRFGEEEGRRKR